MKIKNKKPAFTLAEVLITLGIIGVVAALTLPVLISNYKDKEYKTAYKKAYSDMSNAILKAVVDDEFPVRDKFDDRPTTKAEFKILQDNFIVIKSCTIEKGDLYNCWAKGEVLCDGACGGGGVPIPNGADAFIDASGRSWAMYYFYENLYLVDTNGLRPPNRYGKDRWIFSITDTNGNIVYKNTPRKIRPYCHYDVNISGAFCYYPPCYYQSWLIN